MKATKTAYFSYIDGLRAIAVLAVVAYHLNAAWLPGGFAGVDVFFVISGFIVSASVGPLERFGLHKFFPYFYARRIVRIAPALILMLLVVAVVSALIIPAAWLSQSNQQTGLYAFFGLSNLILARTSNDYFSPVVDFNPFTHTWSLGVEEQFYFIFPLLFFVWTYRGKWRGLATFLLSVAFVASLTYSGWLGHADKTSAYYLITSRFWQLAAGVLLYQTMIFAGRRFDVSVQASPRWFSGAAWLSMALLFYSFIMGRPDSFPYPGSLPVVIGSLGLLGFLHGKQSSNVLVRLLSLPPVQYVGKISYSLYLWHWPIFVFFRWTVGIESPLSRTVALTLSFALAALSYRYVEGPVRHLRLVKSLPRFAVVAIGIVVVACAALAAHGINLAQPELSRTRVARHAADWYPDAPDTDPAFPGCAVSAAGTQLSAGIYTTFSRAGCSGPVTAPHIMAIGDSHAVAYIAIYKRYVLATGASVTLYNNGGCPFMSLQTWREDSASCKADASAAVVDMLEKSKPGDVLFLPSLRMPRFADQFIRFPDAIVEEQIFSERAAESRAAGVKSAESLLAQFHAKGVKVVIEAPTPIFKSPTFRCAETYNMTNPICRDGTSIDRGTMLRLRQPALDGLRQIAESSAGIRIWDPMQVLCPPGITCSAFAGNRPLFFDGDHVSGYGSSLLVPSFTEIVRESIAH
jgi:peptidoglycan/LPS O-acetylase OafA/YrhL